MHRTVAFPSIALLFVVLVFAGCAKQYDIIIAGGTVYDGSGGAPYTIDVGIKGDNITAIGTIDASGSRVIDARGLYVAPGFIDIHTHCDEGLADNELKSAKAYLLQGVTTVVTGNCGDGTFEVAEYFNLLEKQGTGTNIVHLIGHSTIRKSVMGNDNREPSIKELERMKQLVTLGMEHGAAGMSTGLYYAPASFAKTDEIVELAKIVNTFGGIYTSHIRDESNYSIGLMEAVKEAISIGEQADIPVQISHIKALGKPVWGTAPSVCELIESAHDRGVKVFADQYPYSASGTGFTQAVVSRWVLAGGPEEMKKRLNDPSMSARIQKEITANIDRRGGPETLVISSYPAHRDWEGKNLREISEIMGKPVVDTAIEIVLHDDPGVISFNMQDSDIEYFMKKPYVMTASDGSVRPFGQAVPHPRNYGTFPRKIRTYVLENGVISMEHAIRSMTALPADMLGLHDRGMLREGYAADIVVFNPNTISDRATFTDPHQYSEGIEYLVINGKIAVENDSYTGTLDGKALRTN